MYIYIYMISEEADSFKSVYEYLWESQHKRLKIIINW